MNICAMPPHMPEPIRASVCGSVRLSQPKGIVVSAKRLAVRENQSTIVAVRSVWTRLTPAGVERYKQAKPTHREILRETAGGCIEQSEKLNAQVATPR